MASITSPHSVPPGEFRVVPLSSLEPREGFNPRTIRDSEKFAQTVRTVRERGVLQPILVTPDGRPDRFYIVAGEGRYLAAGEAGQIEVPVIVCEVDERTHGLELAMIENLAREELDPVAEARGFAGLKAAGWTKKGIAEFFGISQKLVTERLQIDELPEHLYPGIASGEIPLSAVKPLLTLAKIHPELPRTIEARVGAKPEHSWEEPLGWSEVVEDPIGSLLEGQAGEDLGLPSDVYDASASYPVGRFSLSEKASKDLRGLCALLGVEPEEFTVRFTRESLEQALALKAAYSAKEGWNHLIVGQPVADQLAGDYVAVCLKKQRQVARAQREERKRREHEEAERQSQGSSAVDGEQPQRAAMSEEQRQEQQRKEREQERERREKAIALNIELGAFVVKNLAKVKVDERVLKLLTVFDVHGDLQGIASRGARYGFPGWAQQSETKSGKTRADYLHSVDAAAKAREFLEGAKSASEIAGRTIALLVMARYADEACVARSRAALYELRVSDAAGVPWASEAMSLLEEIAEERLPEHVTASVRQERKRQAELVQAEQRASEAAEELRSRLDEMTIEERLEALCAFGEEHGRHYVATYWLRQDVQRRNAEDRQHAEREAPAAEEPGVEDRPDSEPEPTAEPTGAKGDSQPGEDTEAPVASESQAAAAEDAAAEETVAETV